MNLIRNIRNDFAHNIQGASFAQTPTKERIIQLIHSSRYLFELRKTMNFAEGVKGDFHCIISWMVFHLWSMAGSIEGLSEIEQEEFYLKPAVDEVLKEFKAEAKKKKDAKGRRKSKKE